MADEYKFIHERDRKGDYREWALKINEATTGSDIAIVYSRGLNPFVVGEIVEVGRSLQKKLNVFLYEQELARGGGAGIDAVTQYLTLIQSNVYPILIFFNPAAISFLSSFGKDIYGATLGRLFNNKNLIECGYPVVIDCRGQSYTARYLVPAFLSDTEKRSAINQIPDHFKGLSDSDKIGVVFMYDHHNDNWKPSRSY
jgi:hypothetical protein